MVCASGALSESLQWPCLVTLFLASVVTLIIYLVQYFGVFRRGSGTRAGWEECEEADRLLSWLLELKSWRTEWRRAWIRALNNHRCITQDVQCEVIGDNLQFSLSACPNSGSTPPPLRYSVKISPLQLQLALQMTEVDGEVQITWGLEQRDLTHLQLTPIYTQGASVCLSEAAVKSRLQQVLCETRATVTLSSRTAQPTELKEVRNRILEVSSPPKPPRAHQWKLLVKNVRVVYSQENGAAGSLSPQCVMQLDDPPQKLSTSVLNNVSEPVWDQPFIFELSGRSKELNIQLLDHGKPPESCVLGQVCVPFNLVKRSPRGQHTFTLSNTHQVIGSLTTELSYLEPSEVRTWQPPTPAPTKRVEMDRTVMPCGTVVTTVTAVRSRPGRSLPTESMKPPTKAKLTERRVSEQPSMLGAKVSKALSSSDTELLMLNGTDPVAEAAIRQLYESAKQKLKSPVKKSTIIISGVAKAPLSQDEEMTLMAGYAAAMDASMAESPDSTRQESETLSEPCISDVTDPLEGPSGADWESQTGEESDKASLSLCVSESGSKKGKGSFLHKGARLFFRRRQQRKEPGMSQSHNDLQYLEQAEERRTATFKRIINRKLLPKHKSKANGVQTSDLHQPH
ncbi:C2 domain-containing protein 2 isoform X2 [Hemibagrus wyckioides]|uniref:C2 domain-containing protein 2 isoform X2 n=1 Tax=Hemibagrus wyckioides TaxID=337641 RepID=UPI00266D1889|nr:C2 domain-containing protein 2 isoform X2 [Hemibagrus wyckioides]